MKVKKTTIQIKTETRKALKAFKKYERESYDEIIMRLMQGGN